MLLELASFDSISAAEMIKMLKGFKVGRSEDHLIKDYV